MLSDKNSMKTYCKKKMFFAKKKKRKTPVGFEPGNSEERSY